MCFSCTINNTINRLYERCLCIVYNDKTSSFSEELLEKDGSVVKKFAKSSGRILKVYKKLSPTRIADLFRIRQNNYSYFATPHAKSWHHVYLGMESVPIFMEFSSR